MRKGEDMKIKGKCFGQHLLGLIMTVVMKLKKALMAKSRILEYITTLRNFDKTAIGFTGQVNKQICLTLQDNIYKSDKNRSGDEYKR